MKKVYVPKRSDDRTPEKGIFNSKNLVDCGKNGTFLPWF